MNKIKPFSQTTSHAPESHTPESHAHVCCLMLFAIVAVFMFAALDAPLRAQAGRRRAPEVRQGVVPARSNIETLYLQAQRELNTGQYAAALATLDKIIETDPEFPDAQLARAQALALLKRPREAAEAYRRVVAMTPADTRARYELARVYRQLGEHGAAIAELKEVTRLEPMNSRAYNQLGATYLSLDEAGAAAGAFLQATEADRANTAAEAALERLVNEDATRGAATSSLAAAIYARPLSALARYHYIRALFLSGRRRDATKHMKALEKLDTALWAKLQKEIGA